MPPRGNSKVLSEEEAREETINVRIAREFSKMMNLSITMMV
jgi:hypothetical protein